MAPGLNIKELRIPVSMSQHPAINFNHSYVELFLHAWFTEGGRDRGKRLPPVISIFTHASKIKFGPVKNLEKGGNR